MEDNSEHQSVEPNPETSRELVNQYLNSKSARVVDQVYDDKKKWVAYRAIEEEPEGEDEGKVKYTQVRREIYKIVSGKILPEVSVTTDSSAIMRMNKYGEGENGISLELDREECILHHDYDGKIAHASLGVMRGSESAFVRKSSVGRLTASLSLPKSSEDAVLSLSEEEIKKLKAEFNIGLNEGFGALTVSASDKTAKLIKENGQPVQIPSKLGEIMISVDDAKNTLVISRTKYGEIEDPESGDKESYIDESDKLVLTIDTDFMAMQKALEPRRIMDDPLNPSPDNELEIRKEDWLGALGAKWQRSRRGGMYREAAASLNKE